MHRLDNICSSSVYGFVLKFAPEWGQMPHAPPKTGPETGHLRVLFANERLWRRQFDIDENETNCVNYKYCLVDAPGVSNSCID